MKKQALLVGINDYPGYNNDLRGCINDISNLQDVLKKWFGFNDEDIQIISDAEATKAHILSRLNALIKHAAPGDLLVFHFSGHGSQIRDLNNDDLKDHLDELICPYDMNWDDGFITDDMFGQMLDKLDSGVHMEIILDCCHSGTGTREGFFPAPPEAAVESDIKARLLVPPNNIASRYKGEEKRLKPKKAFATDKSIILNHVLWAACEDFQTSADAYIDGIYNGAFTYYFCKHIRESNGIISRVELRTRILASLSLHHYDQVPQLECPEIYQDRNVFYKEP